MKSTVHAFGMLMHKIAKPHNNSTVKIASVVFILIILLLCVNSATCIFLLLILKHGYACRINRTHIIYKIIITWDGFTTLCSLPCLSSKIVISLLGESELCFMGENPCILTGNIQVHKSTYFTWAIWSMFEIWAFESQTSDGGRTNHCRLFSFKEINHEILKKCTN